MTNRRRQSGVTLTEVTLVVASMMVLFGIALPVTKTFMRSYESATGARTVISGALATARALALRDQRYVGVRFQTEYDTRGPMAARQYMVFIVQDPELVGTYGYGFRAIADRKPVPMPERILVTDLMVVPDPANRNAINPANNGQFRLDDPAFGLTDDAKNALLSEDWVLMDATSFSIVFSPAGKLVVHGVRVWNSKAQDDIFNVKLAVEANVAPFYIDDYWDSGGVGPEIGLGPEGSRMGFLVVERERLRQHYVNGELWTGCLQELASEVVYVSPYTGRVISSD